MRIVMGVKEYESGLDMVRSLERLAFPKPQVDVVHVLEAPGGALGQFLLSASEGDFIAQYRNNQEFVARNMVGALCQDLESRGIRARSQVYDGKLGEQLLEYLEAQEVDLVTVFLARQGPIEGRFAARLAKRLLAEAKTSLLFCKHGIDVRGDRERAVFATDHSDYARRCLDRFLAIAPRGIKHITVMTAFQKELTSALGPFVGHLGLDVSRWVQERLRVESDRVAERLLAAGYEVSIEIRQEEVPEAIVHSMEQNQAYLLVLGAQGHSFVERMTMGSVSMHEVIYGRHPVLVIRD